MPATKSSIGREAHKMVLDSYTEKKNIIISLNESGLGLF
ncbi:MAG: hypothetical protein ACJAWF_003508 [Candidatus Azotimanducaceae bacterium]|jgi:hypothetical protein|tara:strand:+ start:5121 stop:5237 length:117 start_codon:yes stop_codon:yes gene_type:complete